MKLRWLEPVKDWFGHSRRERRSTFILLVIIVIVAIPRYFVPSREIQIEQIPISVLHEEETEEAVMQQVSLRKYHKQDQPVIKKTKSVELNSCDSATLESLPGIGPVLARRIIKYRNLLGGFADTSQLKEVYGLNGDTYNLIKGRFTVDVTLIRKTYINRAGFRDLIRLPYFEKQEITAILKYRKVKGMFNGIQDLVDNKIITREKAEKVRMYLEF